MTPNARPQLQGFLHWIIQKNPTYLISACLTAAGTRLLLVGPSDVTGDLRLIFATLCLLQLYEWAVAAILLTLHRANRSPEDRPSLLLVAAVFWTGPIAATIELMALNPNLGIALAAGVCVIAIGELRLACRTLGLRLAPTAQIIGMGCVVLLAVAARLLKTSDANNGLNELYLYATWWAFAALVLGVVTVVRGHRSEAAGAILAPGQDYLFLAITLIATTVHLIGMNYGFFCHARPFYASPAIVALTFVGFAAIRPGATWSRPGLLTIALLPGVAMILALQGFDSDVPMKPLALWLRDPLIATFIFSAAAWWYGFRGHGSTILLHAAFAALIFVALRVMPPPLMAPVAVRAAIGPTVLFGATAYLGLMALLCRSRRDAVAALTANLAAVVWLFADRSPAANLVICLVAGWSAWFAIHLLARRPRLLWRTAPVVFLAIVPWMLDSATPHRYLLAAHAAGLILILFVLGSIWPWTRYRGLALVLLAGHAVAVAIGGATRSPRPAAGLLLLGGFATLAAGALISWFKRHLVVAVADDQPALTEPQSE